MATDGYQGMATQSRVMGQGSGDTYGSTTGTSGTSRTRGTCFTLEKGRKDKNQEVRAVARRWQQVPGHICPQRSVRRGEGPTLSPGAPAGPGGPMGPVRPRRPSLPGAPSAPLGPGSPWGKKVMVGYLGRSPPGRSPPSFLSPLRNSTETPLVLPPPRERLGPNSSHALGTELGSAPSEGLPPGAILRWGQQPHGESHPTSLGLRKHIHVQLRGKHGDDWEQRTEVGGTSGFGERGTRTLSPLAPGRPAAPRSPGIPCRPGGPWFPGAPGAPASPWPRETENGC